MDVTLLVSLLVPVAGILVLLYYRLITSEQALRLLVQAIEDESEHNPASAKQVKQRVQARTEPGHVDALVGAARRAYETEGRVPAKKLRTQAVREAVERAVAEVDPKKDSPGTGARILSGLRQAAPFIIPLVKSRF